MSGADDGRRDTYFVNLGPSGVTPGLCDPNPGTGFVTIDGKRRLALTDRYAEADNSPDGFGYYVGDAYGGFAPIIKIEAGETGYLIDEFFNIYKKNLERPGPPLSAAGQYRQAYRSECLLQRFRLSRL